MRGIQHPTQSLPVLSQEGSCQGHVGRVICQKKLCCRTTGVWEIQSVPPRFRDQLGSCLHGRLPRRCYRTTTIVVLNCLPLSFDSPAAMRVKSTVWRICIFAASLMYMYLHVAFHTSCRNCFAGGHLDNARSLHAHRKRIRCCMRASVAYRRGARTSYIQFTAIAFFLLKTQ
jgi:hypothetical protein